jgi:hypothetical protein
MSVHITSEIVSQLNEVANQITQIVFEYTKSERGVHVETAVSAPCFLAGTLILRSTGVDLSQLEPGQPVFVNMTNESSEDVVNDTGREVLDFMQKICPPLGLEPFGGWDQPIPENHQPLQSGIDLVEKIGFFGNLHGKPCLWGCFAGFTRKTPPYLSFTMRNPKEPKLSTLKCFPGTAHCKNLKGLGFLQQQVVSPHHRLHHPATKHQESLLTLLG